VLIDWRNGRRFGYPLCCILHYLWDGLMGWPSGMVRWRQIDTDPDHRSLQVVCGVVHSGGSPHRASVRIWRIVAFNLRHLVPTRAGRRRREIATRGGTPWRTASRELKLWANEEGRLQALYWDNGGLDPELDWF
jgi:hypothetical protein